MDSNVVSKFVDLALTNNCQLIFSVSGVTYQGLPLTDAIIEQRNFDNWIFNISLTDKTLVLYNVKRIVSPINFDSYEIMFFDHSRIDSITLSLFEQVDE